VRVEGDLLDDAEAWVIGVTAAQCFWWVCLERVARGPQLVYPTVRVEAPLFQIPESVE